jgi:uncharacterized membrane protein
MANAESALAAAVPERSARGTSRRIQSVDALRGGVMIVMAIDHIRDFINSSAMQFSPTDLTRTTTALFFTRWITHFCAPVFAFTAGMSIFLYGRHRSKGQVSRFLLTRGLWLMLLELTVLRYVMFLEIRFTHTLILLLVIWMLGLSMVAMAALVHLPIRVLAPLSVVVIAGHNLLDPIQAAKFGKLAWLWDILHQQAVFQVYSDNILSAYSLIPWFAVMAAGYCLGTVLLWEPERRRRFLLRLGLALTVGFVVVRGLNVYGDPAPWSVQHSWWFTVLSFLNCTKYPPSLDFLLMTLGPALMVMAWIDRVPFSPKNPLIVFGRVPFFYYVLHLAVIHAVAITMNFLRYGNANFLLIPSPSMGSPRNLFPGDFGFSLWVVYAVWVGVILLLYPVCRWYAELKQRRHDWWLSYL